MVTIAATIIVVAIKNAIAKIIIMKAWFSLYKIELI